MLAHVTFKLERADGFHIIVYWMNGDSGEPYRLSISRLWVSCTGYGINLDESKQDF